MKRFTITTIFILLNLLAFAKNKNTLYFSSGYAEHFSSSGINFELGSENELFKKLDWSYNLRYCYTTGEGLSKNHITMLNTTISYIMINYNNHRFMLGPGLAAGKYDRYNSKGYLEKTYYAIGLDYVKMRYDYTIQDTYRIGLIGAIYGDDGDGTTYFGFTIGYKLRNQ
jgi:hypothetical protein